MESLNEYNFFFFPLLDTDVSLIFDSNFSNMAPPIPGIPFPHFHEVWELYCVSEGSVKIQVSKETYVIKKNQLFLIPPYTEHYLVSGSDDLCRTSIRFFTGAEYDNVENTVKTILKNTAFKTFTISSPTTQMLDQLKDLYLDYINESAKNPWLSARITAISMHFFINVFETLSQAKHIQPPAPKQKENYDLMLLEYLMLCGPQKITLTQIANKLNYSEPQTARIIKKKFGKSFRTLISEIKMKKARFYLIKTDASVDYISNYLGFKNQNSFFFTFKKVEGMSPTEYRKLHKEE